MAFDSSASGEFHSISELARTWGVTQQHLFNLVRRGQLPAHKIGQRIIVRRSDAQKFLKDNATVREAA
jgi:excisionase family DNA binding protein